MRTVAASLLFLVAVSASARADRPVAPGPATRTEKAKPAADKTAAAAKLDGKAAFAILKSLAGTWTGHIVKPDGPPGTITYRVASNGHAVLETLFPDTEHEMLTVYFLDGEKLRANHYCAMGNQPEFVLDVDKSTPALLVFAFAGGTGFDPARDTHIHAGRIALKDPGRLEAEWEAWAGGAKKGAHQFFLARAASK